MFSKFLPRSVVVLALLVLVAAGCAKKPATSGVGADGVSQTRISESPVGYGSGALGETAIGDSRGLAGYDPAADAIAALQRVHFEFDQFTLTQQARDILTGNAAYLRANPELRVMIEGHTDARGSDEYNLALGERRAQSVRNFLVSLGIAADRLSIISYGEEMPLDPRSTEEAWDLNRRAEFKPLR